jgi:hypothetical protein
MWKRFQFNCSNSDNEYAIKYMMKKTMLEAADISREAIIQLILRHENVVEIYDLLEDDLYFYIVVECCVLNPL